ncbi:MAG: alkyl sulfatase dimerization domain-containing protein [Alphaproteobacteria bacterium]
MTDLFALSRAVIDEGKGTDQVGPINRINHQLSELRPDIAVVEAFSHSIVFRTDDGLVAFDTSNPSGGSTVVSEIRRWSGDRFTTIVYTHGHVDHVGGCGAFVADAASHGHPGICICGHENVAERFDRYRMTNGYNQVINERQFGQFRRRGYGMTEADKPVTPFLPGNSPKPSLTYRDAMTLDVGGLRIELNHARGETDDHTWAWIPKHKAICAGDFFIWSFPNAGNPQKVQRYPREWAFAMREMAAKGAELFLPAHGLPIEGAGRIRQVLTDVAEALETLVRETLSMMNDGARLNDILHSVSLSKAVLDKPWLKPTYDEPEFVVRNIWRLYGGWYDGNPANLKPAREQALARELASLAGGAGKLADRALEVADTDIRVACHLVELAVLAEPDSRHAHGVRAEIFQRRRNGETSLMAKGIFGHAANESKVKAE